MSEVIATALISVSATILTTIFINHNAYKQKKLEIENHIKEKKMDYEHEQTREDKNLYFKTFQEFASVSGNDDDRHVFLQFRNLLRYLAGYQHPEGIYIWDIEIENMVNDPEILEEPRYIFKSLNDCLVISSKYLTQELKINKS